VHALTPLIRNYDDARDRPQMTAIYTSAWHATYDSADGATVIDNLIADLLAGDQPEMFALPAGDVALVAVLDSALVGGIRGHPRQGVLHLSGMYIDPNFTRRGIGRALLSSLLGQFSAGTIVRADVRPTSLGAIAFYAQMGFQCVGRSRTRVGGDLWSDTTQMQRALK
jgi:ribosomal protein S18 acetylase RimI-like enzyme